MSDHRHFLRWACAASGSTCGLAGLALAFAHHLHGAPLVVAVAILATTAAATGYAGHLFWRLDIWHPDRTDLKQAAGHVDAAIYTCQVLAALGAILGVYLTASSKAGSGTSAAAAVSGVLDAMANGLLATFTGIVCSLFLFWQHHFLAHLLER